MPNEKLHYAIVYNNGYVENARDNWSWYEILSYIHGQIQSGHPFSATMLLRNGKIIVAENLHNIAYDYGTKQSKMQSKVRAEVMAEFPEPEIQE